MLMKNKTKLVKKLVIDFEGFKEASNKVVINNISQFPRMNNLKKKLLCKYHEYCVIRTTIFVHLIACGLNRFGWDCEHQCEEGSIPSCEGSVFCMPDPVGCSCMTGWMGAKCNQGKTPKSAQL